MKLVIQRVRSASVSIDGKTVGQIARGAVIFLGVGREDDGHDAEYLVHKVSELRMFADDHGKMNVSAREASTEFLVISQFTLYGDCKKGRRPSFDAAALPEQGQTFYDMFITLLRAQGFRVATGVFGAMMQVELVNDGPVTFILEH